MIILKQFLTLMIVCLNYRKRFFITYLKPYGYEIIIHDLKKLLNSWNSLKVGHVNVEPQEP